MDIEEQLREVGLPHEFQVVGHKFKFRNSLHEIAGIITGAGTTRDGLPYVEVSNKEFSSYPIRRIVIRSTKDGRWYKATLYGTSPQETCTIEGKILVGMSL